jgi:hypothetical protein
MYTRTLSTSPNTLSNCRLKTLGIIYFKLIVDVSLTANNYTRVPNGWVQRSSIVEAKQRSQRPIIGWVTKINYFELLRVSEGTLSRWSRLHLQSFVPTPASRKDDVRQAANCKNNCRIFIIT